MKQNDITVDTEYVFQSYGNYEPLAWQEDVWRRGNPQRVRVVQPPSGGKVVVRFVDTGMTKKISNRNLFATWEDHAKLAQEAEQNKAAWLAERVERRRERRLLIDAVLPLLLLAEEKHPETVIRFTYHDKVTKHDLHVIAQELADAGFNVMLIDRRSITTSYPAEDIADQEHIYGYQVLAPAGLVDYYIAGTPLPVAPEALVAIADMVDLAARTGDLAAEADADA